jgi:hypothetical protein
LTYRGAIDVKLSVPLVAVDPGGLDQHGGAAFLGDGAVIGWPVAVGAARVGEDGA